MQTDSAFHNYLSQVLGVEQVYFDSLAPMQTRDDNRGIALVEEGPVNSDTGHSGAGAVVSNGPSPIGPIPTEAHAFRIFYASDHDISDRDVSGPDAQSTDLLAKMLAAIDRPANCEAWDLTGDGEVIPATHLNLILGEAAYLRITGGVGPTFEQAFGLIQTFRERRWLTTAGPAEILKDPNAKRLAWAHIKKFMQELRGPS